MAQWNQTDRTLQTKIVYWGPALGGKTTNLQQIHAFTDPTGENKLISLNTATDRTLFFDLLPLDLGRIFGHTLKIQLYTVPGQVRYDATRRVVLSGADAVVFVADSQAGRGGDNRAAWDNLRANMRLNGLDPATIPVVIQYNKQDLPGCQSARDLQDLLQVGAGGICASAIKGVGVLDTFRQAVVEMLRRLAGPSGRRRAEDLEDLESKIARAFERFVPPQTVHELAAASARSGNGAQFANSSVPHLDLGRAAWGGRHAAGSAAAEAGGASGGGNHEAVVRGAMSPVSGTALAGSGTHAAGAGFDPRTQGSSATTIHLEEGAGGEDLLLRSLRATLGIAEQFGEMREIKNRLARRVGELEGLQALARDLSARRDGGSILHGLADAALAIPGAKAAAILADSPEGHGLVQCAARGLAFDPLLGSAQGSRAARDLIDGRTSALLERLPVEGGRAITEAGLVGAAIAVPLLPALRPAGLILVYGEFPFGTDDERFLGLLAGHAAVCLDNAEMTDRLTRYNERLEAEVASRTAELERANEGLRELDRMKDRFLSSISHEMKTPLTGIVSGAELLSTILPEADHAREFVGMIDHEARRLTALVDRILRFQVLGRGNSTEDAAPIDPALLVTRVVQETSARANAREIGIAIDVPERLPALEGDEEALSLAFREILDNAVKFSPPTGIVQVVVREKVVRWSGGGEVAGHGLGHTRNGSGRRDEPWDEPFLVIAVSDRGPGIPIEDQTRIFERFEQLGDLLTGKPSGLGLGLPIAREVARRHGGDLFVQTPAEGGSEFRLYLPVRMHGHAAANDGPEEPRGATV